MGLHIHLTVQLHHIDSRAWEKTYDESLLLLQRFPAPLIRFEACEIGEYHRYQTTDKIVCDLGTVKERWEVGGDRASGRRAESFCLYRHLQNHLPTQRVQPLEVNKPCVDVLWAEDQAISFPEGEGMDLFGNKTQGYPYHLAVLAVGILFENRFSEHCFVHGQIDKESAKQTLSWVNAVLNTDFMLPICLDGCRLYARLSGLFQDQQNLIKRFNDLFLGSQQDAMRTLVACTEPEEMQRYMIVQLGQCDSLSQLRAIRMLSAYLEAVQNVDSLIDLVLSTPKFQIEPAATLEALLKLLCRRFIMIDPSERDLLTRLRPPAGQMMSIDDALNGFARTLLGIPSAIQFYICSTDLLERFAVHDPGLRERFDEIIATEEAMCRNLLNAVASTLPDEMNPPEKELSAPCSNTSLPGERYLTDQIKRHQEKTKVELPEVIAEILGIAVGEVLRDQDSSINAIQPDHYQKLIVSAGQQNSIVLSREAWEVIDLEKDLDLLKMLAVLMLITEREADFCKWRIHVLEHKWLWPYLIKGTSE